MIIYTITHVSAISHGLAHGQWRQGKKLHSDPDLKFLVLSGVENNKMSRGLKLIFLAIALLAIHDHCEDFEDESSLCANYREYWQV